MFSQWRQAVESLAQTQHSPKPSQDSSSEERQSRPSLDAAGLVQSLSSSTQLAESALSNLKKTLVAQRSASPASRQPASPNTPTRSPATRTTLEDRLKAKFAIGEASNSTSPNPSSRTSRVGTPVTDHPLSPSSTPLPDSPAPSLDLKRPFSPSSIPLPESPALPHIKTTQEDVPAQTLSPPEVTMEGIGDLEREATAVATDTESKASRDKPVEDVAHLPERPPDTPPQHEEGRPESEETAQFNEDSQSERAAECSPPPAEPSHPLADVEPLNSEQPAAAPSSRSSEDSKTEVEHVTSEVVPEEQQRPSGGETSPPPPGPPSPTPASVAPSAVSAVVPSGTAASDPTVNGSADPVVESSEDVSPAPPQQTQGVDVEAIQKRLKLVEQRFQDVSTSFKRLQAEKSALDRVLRELTPLEGVQEIDVLRDYLQNMNLKTEMAQDEIKRLTGKLTRHEERIEELRDIHRLESKSQSELIEKLRGQVEEAEALLKATQATSSQREEESTKLKAEIDRLKSDLDSAKGVAKEEEEKRVKAITLLKTVRQKLVKAEKERDDASKEVQSLKEKEKEDREKDRAERERLLSEVQKANSERETAIAGLKAQFDKEVASLKEKYEKEVAAVRGQFELEIIALKAAHTKELEIRDTRISGLESSVRNLSHEKDELFDQLQMRQAELESSQSLLESLQGQTTEFQYQIREANDRIALLTEELADARRDQDFKQQDFGPSPAEVTRLLSAAEAKYEARIAELRRQISGLERERDEGEAEWSRKLSEKTKEVDSLKAIVQVSSKTQEQSEDNTNDLKKEISTLKEEIRALQGVIAELRSQAARIPEIEALAQSQLSDANSKISYLQRQVEEAKGREAQLKTMNKTLRDEMRKVQSSAALLERQRNPGVGYWASRGASESTPDVRSPRSSMSDLPSQNTPSRPSTPAATKSDEDVNFEYLRNVILQFLEHKEMRPHLVKILSTILQFTPQETRRLISKV